jgi:uncharacterized membrane protein
MMLMPDRQNDHVRKSVLGGVAVGVGLIAAVDEIVFHQLLAWHHFFDSGTPAWGIFSDGLLHSGELILLVAGFLMLSGLRGRGALDLTGAWAGTFIGLGGFQLFDGLVDHKLLRLHQIRYRVASLLPYDLAWNAAGVLLILIGLLIYARIGRRRIAPERRT